MGNTCSEGKDNIDLSDKPPNNQDVNYKLRVQENILSVPSQEILNQAKAKFQENDNSKLNTVKTPTSTDVVSNIAEIRSKFILQESNVVVTSWGNKAQGAVIKMVIPCLLELAGNIPIFGVAADAVLQFYSRALKVYDASGNFKVFVSTVDMVLKIITSRVDIISQKINDEDFKLHFQNLINALDMSKEFIEKFAIDQESTVSRVKGAVNQFAFIDEFEEQMKKSESIILKTMIFISFYAVLSPVIEPSVEQIFKQLKETFHHPYTTFDGDVREHLRRMPKMCREWLIKEVFDWKKDPNGSKIFFLQADAGMGKSAFIASLLHYNYEMLNIYAVFYCKYGIAARSDGAQIILSVALQIAKSCEPYRNFLLNRDYAQDIVLQIASKNWNQLFDELIVLPFEKCEIDGMHLIVIDAIDEIGNTGDDERKTFLKFLVAISKNLPSSIRLLVTGRPETDIVKAFENLNPFVIEKDDERHIEDLKVYLRTQLSTVLADVTELEEAVDLVFKKSNKTFVYVVMVIAPIIEKDEKITLQQLKELPDGIDDVYVQEFERIEKVNSACFINDLIPIIKLIVVMNRPLTVKEVAMTLQIPIDDVMEFAQMIAAMFPIRGDENGDNEKKIFSVFHKSVLDWITDKKLKHKFYIDTKEAHSFFSDKLLLQINKNNNSFIEWKIPEEKNSYLINHLLDHLDGADRQQEARELLMSLPWMMKLLEERGVVELIKEYKSRLEAVVSDFNTAFKMVMSALELSLEILFKDSINYPFRLPIQLYGRLYGDLENNPYVKTLKKSCNEWFLQNLIFIPKRLRLEAPGGALESKFQFKQSINALAVLKVEGEEMIAVANGDNIDIFNRQTGHIKLTLEGHTSVVTCVAVLTDGRVVSGSDDETLRIWNTSTVECDIMLEGHTSSVTCVAVLPDGRVVSGSRDETLRVWNTSTGKCDKILKGHIYDVKCVTVLPDRRVVSGSRDNTLRVWNTSTGECDIILKGHTDPVLCVAVLPDGRVVSGSWDKTLRVWNTSTGECDIILEGHTKPVLCVAVLPDGRVVSGSVDKKLRVWNTSTGVCDIILKEHTMDVNCVAVLLDGRVVSGSLDNTLRVWNTSTGVCDKKLEGHTSWNKSITILNDKYIKSKDYYNKFIWNFNTGEQISKLDSEYDTKLHPSTTAAENSLMEIKLSTQDETELKSYGISENNKRISIETKDGIVWGYGDGNVIIFQRNLHLSNDQLNIIRNRMHV